MTIQKLQEVCSRFGTMTTLVTDNGTQFTSTAFQNFCKINNIDHVRTPPYHPSSNGLAEKFVHTLKKALGKSQGNKDVYLQHFLQTYRATPNDSTPNGSSPAELMFGRKMKIPLNAVLPEKPRSRKKDTRMEAQYNRRHGARLRVFEGGEGVRVRLRPNGKWIKAKIAERVGSVLYNIFLENGKPLRVHTNQLQKDYEDVPLDILMEDDDTSKDSPIRRRAPNRRRIITRSSPPVLRPRPLKGRGMSQREG